MNSDRISAGSHSQLAVTRPINTPAAATGVASTRSVHNRCLPFKPPIEIDSHSYISPAFNSRISSVVLHYTALNFADSVKALRNQVSAHYLIPDPSDPSYQQAGYDRLKVIKLVDEEKRAWHAGVSNWAGRSNLNDTAIGIEMVNLATDEGGHFTFPPYHPDQIDALSYLLQSILPRYDNIKAVNVVGHSDIAPGRKSDPGAAFPWKTLHERGIGAWYDEQTKADYMASFVEAGLPSKAEILNKLAAYGYQAAKTSTDAEFSQLIRAFQLHFRPENYDGQLDTETAAILYALVAKYFPSKQA